MADISSKPISDVIAEVKSAAEKATPGEWRCSSFQFNGVVIGGYSMLCDREFNIARAREKRDAEYIAAVNPLNIAKLIDHIAALEQQLAAELADKKRMDWLVSQYVEVRTPLVYGSHALFVAQVVSEDWAEEHVTALREQIDAAMKESGTPVEGE